MKETSRWYSHRIGGEVRVVRWGHLGTPVVVFPTAGGDAEEIERFHLVGALGGLLEAGRIKVYSLDSLAGRAWLERADPLYCSRLQNAFGELLYREVVPLVRADCRDPGIEIVATGASIGAFNAVAAVCRYPDAFRLAIGMSGTYDLAGWLDGAMNLDFYYSSPIHFLPALGESPQLAALRRRHVVLATGEGKWEDPGESWRMAHVLGSRGVPNRVDPWGPDWHHDWETWRVMLPKYLGEMA